MWVIILLKKIITYLLLFIYLLTYTAYAENKPNISAKSAVSLDMKTNTVLFEKNPYERLPIASTTKVMTCLIAAENGDLRMPVTITPDMLMGSEGTSLYLKAGERITLLDLIKGALIVSGNDAANAIAFALAGGIKDFALLMNEKARELGMANTNFVTPSGLDENGHYSCAYDMALLASYAMKNDVIKSVVSKQSDKIVISGKEKLITNHNKLLSRSADFTGIKTGFTKKAGRCLLSAYNYNGNTIINVTLNAPDDWDDHLALVNYAKALYTVKSGGDKLMINTVGGESAQVKCAYSYSLYAVKDVYVKLYYYPFIYSPFNVGDVVGYAIIYTNGNKLSKVDIKISEV